MRNVIALGLVLAAGCSTNTRRTHTGGDNGTGPTDGAVDLVSLGDMATATEVVYGHSAHTLYAIDPDTLAVTKVADFSAFDEMTDLALDKAGHMVAISATSIYAVDVSSGDCTYLSSFAGSGFNGLSYISADQTANGTEILVGANTSGALYEIDPSTGAQTQLGAYGSGWGSSGDLVSVAGATYATVKNGTGHDRLAKVDASTGVATIVGDTGVDAIYGLAYWKATVYGFTDADGMVTIDIGTGKATKASTGSDIEWYGAGVTTSAPVTIN